MNERDDQAVFLDPPESAYPAPKPDKLGSVEHITTTSAEDAASVWRQAQGGAPEVPSLPSEQEQYVQLFMHQIRGAVRIPAGSSARQCRRCPEFIYDVGKQVVSIKKYKEQPEGIAPTETDDGCGISHWANCPKAAEFRAERGKR